MSVPAETPEEVANGPSSTQRACSTHFTAAPCARARSKNCLFEVARRPSRRPAFARIADPERKPRLVSLEPAEREEDQQRLMRRTLTVPLPQIQGPDPRKDVRLHLGHLLASLPRHP